MVLYEDINCVYDDQLYDDNFRYKVRQTNGRHDHVLTNP